LPKGKGWFWLRTRDEWMVFDFVPFRGICLRWRGRFRCGEFPPPGTVGLRERPDMKKKTSVAEGNEERHLAPVESEVLVDHLALIEHMAVTRYDDGDPRLPGYLTVRTQGRSWVIDVKDPDSCCSFRVVATTIDEALETVQELLSCDQAPWEPDRYLKQYASKKPKK